MKYPPLQEPCKNVGRVEEISFISDKNCKYAEKEVEWKQERIKI